MSIKGVITGDIVDSTSIPIEKREGLLECMSSVLETSCSIFAAWKAPHLENTIKNRVPHLRLI